MVRQAGNQIDHLPPLANNLFDAEPFGLVGLMEVLCRAGLINKAALFHSTVEAPTLRCRLREANQPEIRPAHGLHQFAT